MDGLWYLVMGFNGKQLGGVIVRGLDFRQGHHTACARPFNLSVWKEEARPIKKDRAPRIFRLSGARNDA